jgi:Tfp pilus assembly protein PilN
VAEEEVATLAAVSGERQDPLAVLLLVTRLLPPDAYLRGLHAAGDEWEIDGYARDAARLIPTFEESESLADVRFRTATTRVQLNNETYESFSLALRYLPPAQ